MKITIETTSKIVTLETPTGTVDARIWEGKTDRGTPVHCYVTRICPTIPEPIPKQVEEEFRKSLDETRKPSVGVDSIPLRIIL
jgi:hypothetical protein